MSQCVGDAPRGTDETDAEVNVLLRRSGLQVSDTPVVMTTAGLLRNPSNRELADTIGIRQHQVHQYDFGPPRPENLASLGSIRSSSGQIPPGLDQQLQKLSGIPIVIDDQYAGRHVFTLQTLYVLFNYNMY